VSDKLRGYAHRVDIAADADNIWLALTNVQHLKRWCSPTADIKARPGGLFRASVDRVIELEAHIDVFEPGRRLRLIYLPTSELPPGDTAIVDDFILDTTPLAHHGPGGPMGQPGKPMGQPETIVRLLGSGIPSTPDWDAQYRRLRMGWQAAMTRLKVFVEKQLAPTGTG
jgi:uncharacterized protein YndB with AHSA1/START domain